MCIDSIAIRKGTFINLETVRLIYNFFTNTCILLVKLNNSLMGVLLTARDMYAMHNTYNITTYTYICNIFFITAPSNMKKAIHVCM